MMQLQIHLQLRLLHVLDVRSGIVEETLTLTWIGPQRGELCRRVKATPQQTLGMQLLEPLCVVDVGLATRYVLDVSGISHHDGDAPCLKDRNGPRILDSAVSEILLGFQAASSRAAASW